VANAPLFGFGDYPSNSGAGIWMNSSNQLSWIINQNFNHYSSLLAIPLNTWIMVSAVYNGADVKMYLDGVLKTTTTQTTNPSSSTFIQIFFNFSGGNALCKIDEPCIYNLALTQTQIDLLYNSGNGITL